MAFRETVTFGLFMTIQVRVEHPPHHVPLLFEQRYFENVLFSKRFSGIANLPLLSKIRYRIRSFAGLGFVTLIMHYCV